MSDLTIPGLPATQDPPEMAAVIAFPRASTPIDWESVARQATSFQLGSRSDDEKRVWVSVARQYGSTLFPIPPWSVSIVQPGMPMCRVAEFTDMESALRFGMKKLRELRPLHVFYSGEDWVIAESAEDARDCFCKFFDETANTVGSSNVEDRVGIHASDWEQLDDDKPLTRSGDCANEHEPKPGADPDEVEDGEPEAFTCGDPNCKDGVMRETKTCRQWCEEEGEGHLGSSDL